jgi:SAM-dependent methyltransferase
VSTSFRDRIYATYRAEHGDSPTDPDVAFASGAPYLRALVRKHFPADRDATILDLGCGAGGLVHTAQRAGYARCEGVDASAAQIERARKMGILGIHHDDVLAFLQGREAGTLDLGILIDVLEHLTRDEALALLEELRRVLKPGGKLLIHTPNGQSPFFGRVFYGDVTHEQVFTPSSMNQLLAAARLEVVAFHEDAPIAHGLKSGIRALIWPVLRAALRTAVIVETGGDGPHPIYSQGFLTIARNPGAT